MSLEVRPRRGIERERESVRAVAPLRTSAPLAPRAFAAELALKVFTNGADVEMVAGLYADTVAGAIGNTERLEFAFCELTDEESGNCETDDRGSMRLSAEAAWSFRSSAAECARRCLDCERCRYISFSVGFRDCSWYALRPKAVQWRASRLAA